MKEVDLSVMKITANDLRIGNLVTDEWYESFKKIITVESVNDKGINLQIENSDDYPEMQDHWIEPYYTFDQLRGIELSEEWLIKLGFKSGELDYDIYKQSDGSYSLVDDNGDGTTVYLGNLKYVHQLQNLYFALTSLELSIKE
jgi:hypothetical protein